MYVVCVEFELNEAAAENFMPLMNQQADNSVSLEEGCLRFDVMTNAEKPDLVFLYEIYASQDAFKIHLESDHFKTFDAAVGPMVKDKRVATYDQLYSPDAG